MSENEVLGKMRILGGTSQFKSLKKGMEEREYMVQKAFNWHGMINQMENPVQWMKPTNQGTKVKWESISTQEEYDKAVAKLKGYMTEINALYPEVGIELEE